MEIEVKRNTEKRASKSFIENFIKELGKKLEKRNKNNAKDKKENLKKQNMKKNEEKQNSIIINGEEFKNQNSTKIREEKIENTKLTDEEELELEKKEFKFLQNFFTEELKDLSKGEAYIVTDKYENDYEYNRYKVTQYKNHFECKHIAFKKDLPPNVQLRDIVRKKNNQYTYDAKATKYVKNALDKIKQEIINERETRHTN